MRELNSEQFQQIIGNLATRHAQELAVKDIRIAELEVRLAAEQSVDQGEADAT